MPLSITVSFVEGFRKSDGSGESGTGADEDAGAEQVESKERGELLVTNRVVRGLVEKSGVCVSFL